MAPETHAICIYADRITCDASFEFALVGRKTVEDALNAARITWCKSVRVIRAALDWRVAPVAAQLHAGYRVNCAD